MKLCIAMSGRINAEKTAGGTKSRPRRTKIGRRTRSSRAINDSLNRKVTMPMPAIVNHTVWSSSKYVHPLTCSKCSTNRPTATATRTANTRFNLNGRSNVESATIPAVVDTTMLGLSFNVGTRRAMNVSVIAKSSGQFLGIIAPRTSPAPVLICHALHMVSPAPRKNQCLFDDKARW